MDQSGLGRSTAAPVPSALPGLQLKVFFPVLCPFRSAGMGGGEERERNGRQILREAWSTWHCPPPQAFCCLLAPPPPLIFAFTKH